MARSGPTIRGIFDQPVDEVDIEESFAICARTGEYRYFLNWFLSKRPSDFDAIRRCIQLLLTKSIEEADVFGGLDCAAAYAAIGRSDLARETIDGLGESLIRRTLAVDADPRLERFSSAGRPYWGRFLIQIDEMLPGDPLLRAWLKRLHSSLNDPRDLAHLARSALSVWGPDEARSVLRSIDLSRPTDTAEHLFDARWNIAHCYYIIGDKSAAREALELHLKSDDLHRLGSAYLLCADNDPVFAERCLTRAMVLASTVNEWLSIASDMDEFAPAARIRQTLDRALALGEGVEDREAVARAIVGLLDDIDAADAIGPRGVRPHLLREPRRDLAPLSPDPAALFDRLCAELTPEDLLHIARADYDMGVEGNVRILRDICTTRRVPRSLPHGPDEVIRLTRWSSGKEINHRARLFSATLLLLQGDDDMAITYITPIVDSALTMGDPWLTEARNLLAWACAVADNFSYNQKDRVVFAWAMAMLIVAENPDDERFALLIPLLPSLGSPVNRAKELASLALCDAIQPDIWLDCHARTLVPHADRPAIAAFLQRLGRVPWEE